MLQAERFEKILMELHARGSVKVSRLTEILQASESTIRRDIRRLDEAGRLKKVFGGAVLTNAELAQKAEEEISASVEKDREKIARMAAKLVKNREVVFIGSGYMPLKMISYMESKGTICVTNSLMTAIRLTERGFRVHVIGGNADEAGRITGQEAAEQIKKFNFTKVFLEASGVDVEKGFTGVNMENAVIKRAVSGRGEELFVLAESRSFGVIRAVTWASIDAGTVITDKLYDEEYRNYTEIMEAVK